MHPQGEGTWGRMGSRAEIPELSLGHFSDRLSFPSLEPHPKPQPPHLGISRPTSAQRVPSLEGGIQGGIWCLPSRKG